MALNVCLCIWVCACVSFMYGLYGRGMVCMHPCFFACADSVCACSSIWSASWALWPKSNGRKHQFHHSVFLLPLPLLLSPCIISPLFFPSSPLFSLSFSPPLFDVFLSAEVWLRCCSEHQWSEGSACLYVCACACVHACLVTAWWSEQPGAGYCAVQFTDDVSRWMPPFTITASPLAAALTALLLSFLPSLQKGKKRKKKQLKQDKNKLEEHKWCTWKRKKTAKAGGVGSVWEVGGWFFSRDSHYTLSLFYSQGKLVDLFEHLCMNSVPSTTNTLSDIYFSFCCLCCKWLCPAVSSLQGSFNTQKAEKHPLSWGQTSAFYVCVPLLLQYYTL